MKRRGGTFPPWTTRVMVKAHLGSFRGEGGSCHYLGAGVVAGVAVLLLAEVEEAKVEKLFSVRRSSGD